MSDIPLDWDAAAAGFDDELDHGLTDPTVRGAWRSLLLDHLPTPPSTIADIGCGTGSLAVLLAEAGFRLHGIDLSPAMIDRARTKATRHAVDATFAVGDAAAPPMSDATIDVVLVRHVLWAMADKNAVLRRWARLLRPHGRILLIEGRWSTGAGLSGQATARLLQELGRPVELHPLTEPALWGRPIDDERYLIVS